MAEQSAIIRRMRSTGWILLTVAAASACGAEGPAHRPFPTVSAGDQALLSPANLVTIVPSNEPTAQHLFQFSARIAGTQWWAAIAAEYRLTTVSPVATILGPPLSADVTDHDVYDFITAAVTQNGGPERDGHTLYLLYLPAGVRVIERGQVNADCQNFAAYHTPYGTRGDQLAVVQQCSTNDPFDNMTIAASHEIIEAVTDADGRGYVLPPIAQRRPWEETIWNAYDLTGRAELADLCEGTFFAEGTFVFQRIWSNAGAAAGGDPCIPRITQPFYDMEFEQDWYPVGAGGTISIPVRAWATGRAPSWPLKPSVQGTATGFGATVADATISSGETTTLQVTAPPSAISGAFAVVSLWSDRPTGSDGAGFLDGGHRSLVGVYVP
jgi:hypothetical protein